MGNLVRTDPLPRILPLPTVLAKHMNFENRGTSRKETA